MIGLTAIDLFSGCGGSATGFKNAGFDIKAAADINYWSNKTYSKNHPTTALLEKDIRYVTGSELLKLSGLKKEECDVLLACPPCQGFSSARQKGGTNDPRNELIFDFVRLVGEIRPKMIAMENVPGLSKGIGRYIFLEAVRRLEKLGYKTIYGILNAADYGIPQRRKRVILLATRINDLRLVFPAPSHGERDGLKRYVTVKDAIGDLPQLIAGEVNHDGDYMNSVANLSVLNLARIKETPHNGGSWSDWPMELRLECHKKNKIGHTDVYGRMKWDNSSPTITGGCTAISKGRFAHPVQNRAISLREAARLQSFPDEYVFVGSFKNITEQIGNAVPPLLAQRIAETLAEAYQHVKSMRKLYARVNEEFIRATV